MKVEKLRKDLYSKDKLTKWFAAEVIGNEKKKGLTQYLLKALKDKNIAETVSWALGQIDAGEATNLLCKKLNCNDNYLKWRIISALKDMKKIRVLSKLLIKNKDSEVRWRAAWALGEIKDISTFPVLWKGVHDKNKYVRWKSIWSISLLGPKIIDKLKLQLKSPSKYSRWRAAWALGRIKIKQSKSILQQALKNEKDEYILWQIRNSIKNIR